MGKSFPTPPVDASTDEREVAMLTTRAGQSSPMKVATAANSTDQRAPHQSAQALLLKTCLVYGSPHPELDDPYFRDLSTVQRYYLYCFGTDIQQSLALYHMPGMNPFQSLVQYAEHHELLRQIMIATAALYACRMYHATDVRSGCSSNPHDLRLVTGEQKKTGRALWHPLQDTYQDSIKAKLRALSLLARAIQTGNASNDIVSICILLFVHFELMRPESTESRIHLKGAQAIFSDLGPSERAIQTVGNTVISDSVLFDTIELALDPTRAWSSSIMDSLLPFFKSIGTSNHITFPLQLLHTFARACKALRFCSAGTTMGTETITGISTAMERIAAIDARSWAESFHGIHSCTTCPDDLEIRIHLCEAHKAASIIFLARAAGLMPAVLLASHQARLLEHLEQVSYGQSLFKATSWPTFIAGLEANDERVASELTDRLQFMCSIIPYDFARRALRMLKGVRLEAQTYHNANVELETGWFARLRLILPTI